MGHPTNSLNSKDQNQPPLMAVTLRMPFRSNILRSIIFTKPWLGILLWCLLAFPIASATTKLKPAPHSANTSQITTDSEVFKHFLVKIDHQTRGTLVEPIELKSGRNRIALIDPSNPDETFFDNYVYIEPNRTYGISDLIASRQAFTIHISMESLALDPAIDHLAFDHQIMPGAGVSLHHLFSLPFDWGASYSRLEQNYTRRFDEANSPIKLRVESLSTWLSLTQQASRDWQIRYQSGLARTVLNRRILNSSFDRPDQRAVGVYPFFATTFRYQLPIDRLGLGFTIQLNPSFLSSFRSDSSTRLKLASAKISLETSI